MAATAVLVTTWQGCYGDSWQDLIVPEAFAHPAKAARGLSHRIYRHLLDSGYVRPGDTVLDPFAGIGGFCLDAMTYGLRYIGVELEPKFVELGNKNLDLWRQRYGFTGGAIVQGDSRRLRDIFLPYSGVQAVVGSPPYAEMMHDTGQSFAHVRARGGTSAKPFGALADGSSMSCSSYGTTPGQLGAMPPGAVVSSPPYEASLNTATNGIDRSKMTYSDGRALTATSSGPLPQTAYSAAPEQLGNTAGDTFWSASAQIMAELAALLPPGAVCAWVLKAYVSKKAIVPFPDQWRALCEAHGFETCEIIHASLIEHHGVQETFFGEPETVQTSKKSFFRRLCEKKGSPSIDHEDILIMVKASL